MYTTYVCASHTLNQEIYDAFKAVQARKLYNVFL